MDNNLAYQEEPREELIGGKWVAMAPASTNHNRVKGNIYRLFANYLEGRQCEVLPDGEGLYLSEQDEYIPDVMVVCDPEKIHPNGVHGAPDLVAEVISPGTARNDRGRKKDVYEKSGVREYWLVDPENKIVEQYILSGGIFQLHDSYAVPPDWMLSRMRDREREALVTEFKCSLYDDLIIRMEDIFARVK